MSAGHTLRQQLPGPLTAHLREALVGVPYLSQPKGTQTDGDHHAFEEDHGGHVPDGGDVVLEVGHEEEVAGGEEAVMECVVVNVAHHGMSFGAVGSVLVDVSAEVLD